MILRICTCLLALAALVRAQRVYTYVGDIGARSAIVAWGTTAGRHTIGRDSIPMKGAQLRIAGRVIPADRNWVEVRDLQPDTAYPYEVLIQGRKLGEGSVRTYPERANQLTFFVIGDYGNGSRGQWRVARAMTREFEARRNTDSPVRFVLTTGDNIYSSLSLLGRHWGSGDHDSHWEGKFFAPYEPLLRHVPFRPSIGNHDGNESESPGDLSAYLDNFFFPGGKPARYYSFSFGGLADFFALDTTEITERGPGVPFYLADGEQFLWLQKTLRQARSPWRIAYFHHPPFTAGPNHSARLVQLRHLADLFAASGVKAVFNGHEHNFQFSERNTATGGVLYVVTGAGGELRGDRITEDMGRANIAGWSAQRHFLVVEIQDQTMTITPSSDEPVNVTGPAGQPLEMPVVVKLGEHFQGREP